MATKQKYMEITAANEKHRIQLKMKATAALKEQVEEELKEEDPTVEDGLAAIAKYKMEQKKDNDEVDTNQSRRNHRSRVKESNEGGDKKADS